MGFVLFGVAPWLFTLFYPEQGGLRISFGQAFHHVYFLLFGQPSLPYVDRWSIELMNLLIPPLGIAVVIDGIVRFAYLYFAKHRSEKEWIEVQSQMLTEHTVVCGAGRVGYRVAAQLLSLGEEVVVIEKREDAAFVSVLRDLKVPVLIDDIKSPQALERTHVTSASAIVCATDDDLANLNVALDARRLNPSIRVVIRLFDDDLVAKVRGAFKAEALSSSALAAPAMALSALDPRIVHSFQVGGHLLVVSDFIASDPLLSLTVGELRDRFGALALWVRRQGGEEALHPKGETRLAPGDVLTLQMRYEEYLALREFTKEAKPPLHGGPG